MTDSAPKIVYKEFDTEDMSQRTQIRSLINDSGMHCTGSLPGMGSVALIRNYVVGFMGGHIKYAGSGHIDIFVVEHKHQREGVGLALGQHFITELNYRDCTTFTAVTEPTATSAIALYRSLGVQFKVIYEFESDIDSILLNIRNRLKEKSNGENIPVV